VGLLQEYEKGDTARFEAVFRDNDGEIIEPDATNNDHDVRIQITDLSADDILVETEDMEELSDTRFRYDWQTTEGMRLGEYEVEVRGNFQGDEALNRDRVRLVRTKEKGRK